MSRPNPRICRYNPKRFPFLIDGYSLKRGSTFVPRQTLDLSCQEIVRVLADHFRFSLPWRSSYRLDQIDEVAVTVHRAKCVFVLLETTVDFLQHLPHRAR